jgi:hypothetical protein
MKKLEIEKWIERGFDSFKLNQWFDGIQYIQGGLQRTFQSDDVKKAETIFQATSKVLFTANRQQLFCKLVMDSLPHLRKKISHKKWIMLYPVIFSIFNKEKMESCIFNFINRMIADKKFQDEEFIQEMHSLISRGDTPKDTKSNLYFFTAGLLCWQREYVKCFEMLTEWNKLVPSSPKILTYLTLAELNAFELDGVSKYLTQAKSIIEQTSAIISDKYVEIGSQLFKAVELRNYELLHTIVSDYGEVVDIKKDALLNALCEGLADFLKPKSNKNMFSLFG